MSTGNYIVTYCRFKHRGWLIVHSALFLMLLIFIAGCSVQSKLEKTYKGESFSRVMDEMGAPTRVENLVGGGTVRIYERKKMLKEAPINTGQFQYDTFNSPKVLETEVIQFYVSQSGQVTRISYSKEFSR